MFTLVLILGALIVVAFGGALYGVDSRPIEPDEAFLTWASR